MERKGGRKYTNKIDSILEVGLEFLIDNEGKTVKIDDKILYPSLNKMLIGKKQKLVQQY